MRIALCYKENLVREAMEKLVSADGAFDVVVSAAKLSMCLSGVKVHGAKVVVCEFDGLDKEEVTKLAETTEGDKDFFLLLIGGSEEAAQKAKVQYDKFVPKSANTARLYRALQDLFSKDRRPRLILRERPPIYAPVTILTPREHEIALKVGEGLSNRDISIELNLAEQTVKNLVSVVMRKMSCRNRTQFAMKLASKS